VPDTVKLSLFRIARSAFGRTRPAINVNSPARLLNEKQSLADRRIAPVRIEADRLCPTRPNNVLRALVSRVLVARRRQFAFRKYFPKNVFRLIDTRVLTFHSTERFRAIIYECSSLLFFRISDLFCRRSTRYRFSSKVDSSCAPPERVCAQQMPESKAIIPSSVAAYGG